MLTKEYFEIIEKILLIVAFGLALKQLFDSKKQIKQLQDLVLDFQSQTNRLSDIEKSLTTRFIGLFPAYISELDNLVQRTKRTLKVLCDFPAYGAFSNRLNFLKYKQSIEHQINFNPDFSLQLICLDAEERDKANNIQFSFDDESQWDSWKGGCKQQLETFLKEYAVNNQTAHDISFEDFKRCLEACNLEILSNVFKERRGRITVKQISDLIPVYFWIRDDDDEKLMDAEALLVFRSFIKNETEFGFLTNDPKLIRALRSIFKSIMEDAIPSHSVIKRIILAATDPKGT